jgi:DNA (cytosine-5)-methyltransferase 1
MTLNVFEAFAGIGAQAAALRNIGVDHKVIGIAEINKWAIKGYMAIHGDTPNFGDITKIDPATLPDIDLFTYSFPCQDLSSAGLQKGLEEGSGTRSGLLWECRKIIDAKRPKYLMLENVKNLVGKKHKANFDKWIAYLDSVGYNTYWKVLNGKDYGVPQNRERVFAVSILKEHDKGTFTFDHTPVHVPFSTVKEANAPDYLYNVCPSMLKAIDAKKCKIISDEGLSCCLTTKQQRWNNGGFVQTDKGLRYLSGLEQFRLMGFSDADYNKAKEVLKQTHVDFVCGNSIVVKVLESIFSNLLTK